MSARGYTVTSGFVALTVTTQTAILFATASATVSFDAVAIRCSVATANGTTGTYPANASVRFTLAKTTLGVGTTTVTPSPTNNLDIAAQSAWFTAFSTAPTIGKILWEHNVAFAAGASWGEGFALPELYRRLGGIPATADQWAVFAAISTTGGANTGVEVTIDGIE